VAAVIATPIDLTLYITAPALFGVGGMAQAVAPGDHDQNDLSWRP
jgi:hypothetical protein